MVSVESRNTIIGKECLKKKDELEKKKKKNELVGGSSSSQLGCLAGKMTRSFSQPH